MCEAKRKNSTHKHMVLWPYCSFTHNVKLLHHHCGGFPLQLGICRVEWRMSLGSPHSVCSLPSTSCNWCWSSYQSLLLRGSAVTQTRSVFPPPYISSHFLFYNTFTHMHGPHIYVVCIYKRCFLVFCILRRCRLVRRKVPRFSRESLGGG